MKYVIFDIEADELLDKITKIHCLSYCIIGEYKIRTLYSPEEIINFFNNPNYIYIGHSIRTYDLPAVNKIYGVNIDNLNTIDTLFLSWYLFPTIKKYGLEYFGEYYKIPKIVVKDWVNGTKELYTLRCETDVKINTNLYVDLISRLKALYDLPNEWSEVIDHPIIKFLNFKADCAVEMMNNPMKIDLIKAYTLYEELMHKLTTKKSTLESYMPLVNKYGIKNRPKVYTNKDGGLSKLAKEWEEILLKNNLPLTTPSIKYIKTKEEPNAQSYDQLKDWLFSIGWQPLIFKNVKDKNTGDVRKVPQILNDKRELCPSIVSLKDKYEGVIHLEEFGILKHRSALVNGLIEASTLEGYVVQEIMGLTSTFRMKHGTVVNLPGTDKLYGEQIRGLFIAPEDKVVFGVDIKNLESKTKDHFIKPYDPDYVETLSDPNYDSHLALGVVAGLITEDEAEFYKYFKLK